MTQEQKLKSDTLKHLADSYGTTMFVNNTGMGWQGKIIAQTANTITIQNPRPLHAGLFVGSSDLIGWHSVNINGSTVAVFVSAELKAGKNTTSPEQAKWIASVKKAGGITGVVRKPEDIDNLIYEYVSKLTGV